MSGLEGGVGNGSTGQPVRCSSLPFASTDCSFGHAPWRLVERDSQACQQDIQKRTVILSSATCCTPGVSRYSRTVSVVNLSNMVIAIKGAACQKSPHLSEDTSRPELSKVLAAAINMVQNTNSQAATL